MKPLPALGLIAAVAAVWTAAPAGAGGELEGVTAVASKVYPGYVRARLADGHFKPESYAFGEGGKWAGEIADQTIDQMRFLDVAHVIAGPLASQAFLPAKDPATAQLLIMVYWGTTAVPGPASDSIALGQFQLAQDNLNKYLVNSKVDVRGKVAAGGAYADAALDQMSAATAMLNMQNHQDDKLNYANALMLGYDAPGLIGTEHGNYVRGTAFQIDRDDLYEEITENRYFVVLMAYDFQTLWKQKKHRLLWETRFSISERRNAFNRALPTMAQYAARYFGQPSNGLVRERLKEGRVDVGAPTMINFVDEPKK
jgi:hypothetical protein